MYLSCRIEYQGRLQDPAGTAVESLEFYKGHSPLMGASQGFIQDIQFGGGWGGGDVVRGLTGMGEYFSQVMPRSGAKSIVVSFC